MSCLPPQFDYHGPHVAAPQAGVVRVEWMPVLPRADRLRVRGHTCACRYPMFERCTAGGLWFVRHYPFDEQADILESAWMSACAARTLWMQILTGQAR